MRPGAPRSALHCCHRALTLAARSAVCVRVSAPRLRCVCVGPRRSASVRVPSHPTAKEVASCHVPSPPRPTRDPRERTDASTRADKRHTARRRTQDTKEQPPAPTPATSGSQAAGPQGEGRASTSAAPPPPRRPLKSGAALARRGAPRAHSLRAGSRERGTPPRSAWPTPRAAPVPAPAASALPGAAAPL